MRAAEFLSNHRTLNLSDLFSTSWRRPVGLQGSGTGAQTFSRLTLSSMRSVSPPAVSAESTESLLIIYILFRSVTHKRRRGRTSSSSQLPVRGTLKSSAGRETLERPDSRHDACTCSLCSCHMCFALSSSLILSVCYLPMP